MKNVTIVDYSSGNLYSLIRALESLGSKVRVGNKPTDLYQTDYLIFPGDGAFGDGMRVLKKKKLASAIKAYIKSKKPFLGICLGMQILFEESEEFEHHEGLGIFGGKVVRLFKENPPPCKLPHIGWNQIIYNRKSPILNAVRSGDNVYFLHSYKVIPTDKSIVLAQTTYGQETFCSMIKFGSIVGCQFHPETSDRVGLQILKNFLSMRKG